MTVVDTVRDHLDLIDIDEKDKVIYLSGPITSVENYKQKFNYAIDKIMSLGYHFIINPSVMGDEKWSWEKNMRLVLADMVARADIIYMLPDWERSRGATWEKEIADMLKIPVKYIEDIE